MAEKQYLESNISGDVSQSQQQPVATQKKDKPIHDNGGYEYTNKRRSLYGDIVD